MKIAVYVKNPVLLDDPRVAALQQRLREGGCALYALRVREDLRPGTDALLSVGGDGTFLSAAKRVADSGVPVLGVNLGRLGFLSEYPPEEVAQPLLEGQFSLEDRGLLQVVLSGGTPDDFWPYALNEMSLCRHGAAMLGLDVCVDGVALPTWWADGLLVATPSGSTAYALSVGGPVVEPRARVLILAPIAPHNLNVRPLVVPDSSEIRISVRSRDPQVAVTLDNRNLLLDASVTLDVRLAQFSLKRIRLGESSFYHALTTKLFWGEDIRNER